MAKMSFEDLNKELTDEEIRELEDAEKRTPLFDSDSQAMTKK